MAIRYLEDEEIQPKKIRYIDEQPQDWKAGLTALSKFTQPITNPKKELEQIAQRPVKENVISLLKGAQTIGQFGLPYLSGITTTPATQYGIEKLEGEPTSEALKQAAIAGGIDLAIPIALKTGGKILKAALPTATSFLTGIPKEGAEQALQKEIAGKSIFKGKFKPKEMEKKLGAETIDALDNLKKGVGKEINAVKQEWKNVPYEKMNAKVAAKNVSNSIQDLLESRKFGKKYDLDVQTVDDLKNISNEIKKVDNIGDLYTYIGDIDDKISYDVATGLKKATPRSEGALKEARGIIRDELGKISPKYSNLADKYSEVSEIHNSLRPLLKDKDIAGSQVDKILTKSLEKPEDNIRYAAQLDRLNEMLPNKIIDKLKENSIRQQYEKIFPDILSKHISPLGIAALAGGGYGAAQATGSKVAGIAALLAAMSPKVHKKAIQAFNPMISKKMPVIGKAAATKLKIADLLGLGGQENGNA